MEEAGATYRPEQRDEDGEERRRWFGPVALAFAGLFAAAAVACVVLDVVTKTHVETTTYYAAAALLFLLLAMGTVRERAKAGRGEQGKHRRRGSD